MEDTEEDREHKYKKKKKRKLENEDELLDYSDIKKRKKKRKRTDENAEDVNEGLENTHKHHTTRRRKDSEGESDWSGRRKSNTELIKVRALNKQEKTGQENEPVTHKKRKKKKMEHEESVEDSGVSEDFTARKKMKKKRRIQYEERTEDDGNSDQVIERKEKKKKYEDNMRDGGIRDQSTARKKKKKKRSKLVEDAEILETSVESLPASPVVEKGGDRGRENLHPPKEHVFLKPFPVQERGGGGAKDKRRESCYYRNQGMREKRVPDEEERRWRRHSHIDQRRNESYHHRNQGLREERVPYEEDTRAKGDAHIHHRRAESYHRNQGINEKVLNEEERRERSDSHIRKHGERLQRNDMGDNEQRGEGRVPEVVPRFPYSGTHGWETDTSTDDLDYSDDCYHEQPYNIRKRVVQTRSRMKWSGEGSQVSLLYSEGDEIEGFVPDPRYSSDSENSDWLTVEVPPHQRQSPGLALEQRDIATLEEAMYKFPPGVGIPPEDIEEVKDVEDYWIMKDKNLQVSSYAEEAKEYIDEKIQRVEDYFKRLEAGKLTPSEMKETRPEDFDEPFFPTPKQLLFLDTLNIKVNWPLDDLHRYHLTTYTIPSKTKARWQELGLFAETGLMTVREEKIIARNWFAFQKEYGFYDLRPLVSVRTALIVREDGRMFVQPNNYLSLHNKVHFLLYLAKDLPNRPLLHIYRRIRRLLPRFQGRQLMRRKLRVTGFLLAKALYVMEVFGTDFLAAELLIGLTAANFSHIFTSSIFLRNVKLRIGPWRRDEDERFLRGLQEVLRVKTFEEAYGLRKVPWISILPYVRTRGFCYMRRRLILLASREGEKDDLQVLRRDMARFIRLLYNKHVDSFSYLNWEELAKEVGAANPIRLVWFFRRVYVNYIPYYSKITVAEGLRYMYKNMVPFYEKVRNSHRTSQRADQANADNPDDLSYLGDLHYLPDPSNPSGHPSNHSSEPSSTTDDHSTHSNPSNHPNTHSSESIPSSTTDDHSTPRMTSKDDQLIKKHTKVTRKQNDLETSRKAKNSDPDDLTDPRNMTSCNVPSLSRSTQQNRFEDDPSGSAFPYQCDLMDNLVIHDLSDSDDDLTSDSDCYDFEQVTLGQAARYVMSREEKQGK